VDRDINPLKAIEVFKNLNDRCIPILAPPGLRGHATLRILCSHDEVWWDSSLMNYNGIPDIDSLIYPDDNILIDFRAPTAPYKINYMSVHTMMITTRYLTSSPGFDIIKDYYANSKNTLQSHTIFQASYLEHIPSYVPFIYLYTSNIEYTMRQRSLWFSRDFRKNAAYYSKQIIQRMSKPTKHLLAFNIDIHKLFSKDDLIFEMEYMKIVNHFNFTANINRVRSFILLYLEREKSVNPHKNQERIK